MVSPITEGFVNLNVVAKCIESISSALPLDIAKLIAQYAERTDVWNAQKWREEGVEIEEPSLPDNIDALLRHPHIKDTYVLALVARDIHRFRAQGVWMLISKKTEKTFSQTMVMGMGKHIGSRNLYTAVIGVLDPIKSLQGSDDVPPIPQTNTPYVRVLSEHSDSDHLMHSCDGCARCCFDPHFRTPRPF